MSSAGEGGLSARLAEGDTPTSAGGATGGSVGTDLGRELAFATMITSDDFVMGLETMVFTLLASRLAAAADAARPLPPRKVVVMATAQVSDRFLDRIRSWSPAGVELEMVEPIANPHADSVHVEGWVNSGFTKLHLWRLTRFAKLVYIDADCTVTTEAGGLEDLFERPGAPMPAAAPDVFPPDKFNAGVMVVEPDAAVFEDMMARAAELPSHDGGDTGFLNSYFPGWFEAGAGFRLPFRFNAQRTLHWLTAAKAPGYWEAVKPLKIIHYCSSPKPWGQRADGKAAKKGELEILWWGEYLKCQLAGGPASQVRAAGAAAASAGPSPLAGLAAMLG